MIFYRRNCENKLYYRLIQILKNPICLKVPFYVKVCSLNIGMSKADSQEKYLMIILGEHVLFI